MNWIFKLLALLNQFLGFFAETAWGELQEEKNRLAEKEGEWAKESAAINAEYGRVENQAEAVSAAADRIRSTRDRLVEDAIPRDEEELEELARQLSALSR